MRHAIAAAPVRGALPAAIVGSWRGRVALVVLLALTAGGIVRAVGSTSAQAFRTQPVTRGTVTQTAIVFGAIDASAAVKLNFKASGKVAKVTATVGQSAAAGTTLAQLDTADLQIALAGAKAGLANAQARYDQTLAGASAEDIALARSAVDSAQRLYDQAQSSAQSDVGAAQQALDNARRALDRARQSGAADVDAARAAVDRIRTAYASARAGFSGYVARIASDVAAYRAAIEAVKVQVSNALGLAGDASLTADVQPALTSAITSLGSAQTSAFAPVLDALRDASASADAVTAAANAFDQALAAGGDVSAAAKQLQAAQTKYQVDSARLGVALDVPASLVASASASVTSASNALNSQFRAGNARYDDARAALSVILPVLTADTQVPGAIKAEIAQAAAALLTIGDAVSGTYVSALQAAQSAQARVDSGVTAAESALATAQRALASAQDRAATSVTSQQNALRSAQLTLEKTSASARATDIAAAYANVLAQQAAVDRATADLGNATLVAPSGGVVTAVNGREGEFVTGGNALVPFLVFQPTGAIALRGSVGEADVARIRVGQSATIALEAARGASTLRGRVTSVDPSATITQGSAAYSVEVTVDEPGAAASPGMTGTASIVVARKDNALLVPAAAVHDKDGKRAVTVWSGGAGTETEVTIGVSDDTAVEITGGLREGQEVVVSEGATAQGSTRVSATAPFSYPLAGDPTLERIAVVIQVTNRSSDDLVIALTDFLVRDTQHRIYPADPQATVADARVVRSVAALHGTSGARPLQAITLRKDDVLVGFVVFSVPAGTRPSQLVYRQTDADVVVDLTAK